MVGKQRNFGLDVVRAVSILCVLMSHRFAFDYEIGLVGVQIFFILSGFLIGQILLKDFENEGTLSTILKFWKRRWYRTLPLYYLVLVFKIFFYGNPYGWKIITYFLFLQANFVGIKFFSVSWSLVVEEWFYLFLPLATFLFFRKGIDFKKYARFLFLFIVFFLSARFIWNYTRQGVILYQFDCLLLGVFLSLIKSHVNSIYRRLNSFYLFLLGLFGTISLTYVFGDIRSIPLYDPFYRVSWYFLISLFIVIMIPFVEMSTMLNVQLKKVRPLYHFFTWTSILTYSIYLLHMEVYGIEMHFKNDWMLLFVQMVILYSICFVVYTFFEHPMLSLREKLSVKQYIESIKSSFKGKI